jgi:hypothetical protein
MKYLIPLGAVGVLYVADNAEIATAWSPLVMVGAVVMVVVALAATMGKGAGNGR